MHLSHDNPTNGRVNHCAFGSKDVNAAMFVIAPRMPKRLRVVTFHTTTFNWVLDIGRKQHVYSYQNNHSSNDSFQPFFTILLHTLQRYHFVSNHNYLFSMIV